MGRGSSKASSGGGSAKAAAPKMAAKAPTAPAPAPAPQITDFSEAFAAGQDFERSGDVNHYSRTVSSKLQRQWDGYADSFGKPLTAKEEAALMKEWDPRTGALYGYVRTTNSFAINQALYNPNNAGKSIDQIFTRKDRQGRKRDLETVKTLDKAINAHKTPADASYSRFGSANSVQATFGLTNAQMSILNNAKSMTPAQLNQLNAALRGKSSYSAAYTSTSANRSMNAFKDPGAKQSKGFTFERKINTPKGTNALAMKKNAQESEVIFGRGLETRIDGISIAKDGHIVIHESFVRYR